MTGPPEVDAVRAEAREVRAEVVVEEEEVTAREGPAPRPLLPPAQQAESWTSATRQLSLHSNLTVIDCVERQYISGTVLRGLLFF